jgi:hypothetical protein
MFAALPLLLNYGNVLGQINVKPARLSCVSNLSEVIAIEISDLADAGEQHGRFQFDGKLHVDAFNTERSTGGQAPQRGTPDADSGRPQCERPEDIDAATDRAGRAAWRPKGREPRSKMQVCRFSSSFAKSCQT